MGGTRRGNEFFSNTGQKMPIETYIGGGPSGPRTSNVSGAAAQQPPKPYREYRVRYKLMHESMFTLYRHWLIVEYRTVESANPWNNEGWLRIMETDHTWHKIKETAKGQLSDRRWYQLPYVQFDLINGALKFSDPGKAMAVKLMMVFE